MLRQLRIRNFALIDRLTVTLGEGLNVLTGETGAGKSIIVGALSLLLGERASADLVRAGEERASIEGVFDISGRPDLRALLDERGVDVEDDVLVLKREVAAEGRSRAWLNGSPATATLLGELGRLLVDLHGQHEHQTLLRREEQRVILDSYAGHADLAQRVQTAHRAVHDLRREQEELERRARDLVARADFLRFQLAEIEAARLEPGEDERIEQAARRLSHAEELIELASSLADAVGAADDAVSSRLGGLRRPLERLIRIDPAQSELQELYDTAYYALVELGDRLASYSASVEHDPARLEEVRQRQDLIYRLCAKYGATIADVIATGSAARAELDLLDTAEWEIAALKRRAEAAATELARLCAELSERRARAAAELTAEVERVLPELGMSGGSFAAVLLPLPEPGARGAEEVEFRVSLNRGFELRPLASVASGGELSRVMLALKTILARVDAVPTLIFDEVDAGIGGRVAQQVGEKMRRVAETHQVFAITHLPQIAARAHTHLFVRKRDTAEGSVATEVWPLDAIGRVEEVARMLGGDPESRLSLEHARELLERGARVAPLAGETRPDQLRPQNQR